MLYIFLFGVLFILFLIYKGIKRFKKYNQKDTLYVIKEKTDCTILEKNLVDHINKYRKDLSLNPLIIDTKASDIAKIRNQDIQIEFSHKLFADRAKVLYIDGANALGENIAYGYKTITGVFNAWKKSEGHHKNLIGEYDAIGINIVKDKNNNYWYCTIFLNDYSVINKIIKSNIEKQ